MLLCCMWRPCPYNKSVSLPPRPRRDDKRQTTKQERVRARWLTKSTMTTSMAPKHQNPENGASLTPGASNVHSRLRVIMHDILRVVAVFQCVASVTTISHRGPSTRSCPGFDPQPPMSFFSSNLSLCPSRATSRGTHHPPKYFSL